MKRKEPTKIVDIPGRPTSASEMPPVHVLYQPNGTMLPRLPIDPDKAKAEIIAMPQVRHKHRLPNGLPPRVDLMARLMARGIGPSDAYRCAYSKPANYNPTHAAHHVKAIQKRHEKFSSVLGDYRQEWQERREQHGQTVRDFVMTRLTYEAQTAPESSSRIKALDLLGKSQAMWTTVHKVEKSIAPKDLQVLKTQLEQRFRAAIGRLSATDIPQTEGQTAGPDPHRTTAPLLAHGTPPPEGNTIPPAQFPESPDGTQIPVPSGNIMSTPLASDSNNISSGRELEDADLGDFSGPLVSRDP